MDPLLRNKLQSFANEFAHNGIEAFDNLTVDEFADLESMLNTAISQAEDWDQDELVKLRFLFRVWLKYGTDVMRGLTILQKFEE